MYMKLQTHKGKKVTQTFPTKDKLEIRREKYCVMLKCNTSRIILCINIKV